MAKDPKCHSDRSEESQILARQHLSFAQDNTFQIVYKNKGFIMVLVIMAITAVGMVMFVLAADANTMIFQSDMARLKAAQRNATASALAWARHNITNTPAESLNKTVNLDTAELNIPAAALAVTITAPAGKTPHAQITASVARKRRTLKTQDEYVLAK
ncbi:MAG: hypothetical protein JXN61_08485 [Sedimentisphaerales bacterium]|nr:hypothetical protein [Sedimentisphaerales bacterium]